MNVQASRGPCNNVGSCSDFLNEYNCSANQDSTDLTQKQTEVEKHKNNMYNIYLHSVLCRHKSVFYIMITWATFFNTYFSVVRKPVSHSTRVSKL